MRPYRRYIHLPPRRSIVSNGKRWEALRSWARITAFGWSLGRDKEAQSTAIPAGEIGGPLPAKYDLARVFLSRGVLGEPDR